ncbi:serine hydrolase [Flagellimonas sp.]|uniref:serine hydrolase n=1 Tax=Flagellimonas sp. TaxID=2058762 RepID=UPI003B5BCC3E
MEDLMQDYAENGRKELGSPFTGAVLVAKDGNILFNKAYGLKDRNNLIPNDVATKFPIGSLTKQFTAMLVVQMAEEGILELEDPVSKHLEYLPKEFADVVTIHQLLSHTSGLPHYEGIINMGIDIDEFARTKYSPKELAILVSKVELNSEPGTNFHYSSLGYMLLGAILEKVSGESFAELLEIKITKPLGLNDTGFASNKFIKNETAKGYAFKEDKTFKMIFMKYGGDFHKVPFRDQSNTYTGGGMHSTVGDLLKWSEAVRSYTLLSPKFTEIMLKPNEQGYGYGWIRNWEDIMERNTKVKLYSHTGSTFGHASAITMFDDGTTIILTCNVNRIKVQKIVHQLYLLANGLKDIYGLEGYPDRGSLAEFEEDGGVKAFNAYFEKLSELCGYEVKPSEGSLTHIMSLYYKNGINKVGDSLKQAYFEMYKPNEGGVNQLGYRILNINCEKAIEVFEENTRLHPETPNTWDSLGDGYLECNNYVKAAECFSKAVVLAKSTNNPGLKYFQGNLQKVTLLLNE